MQQLVDSSTDLANPIMLRKRLFGDGALFFRGLLDPDKIYELRSQILEQVAAYGWTDSNKRPAQKARFEGDADWWPGYRAIQRIEDFHALAYDLAVVGMFETLFGKTPFVHPRKIARVVWPKRPAYTTAPHQDFPLIAGTIDFFTMWVPLGTVSSAEGGLRVLLGSHRHGVRTMHSATGAGGIGINVADDDPAWATIDFQPGDALIFHSMTVHAGMPNVSDDFRVSADFRYQPIDEPVGQWSISPHIWETPEAENWDDFSHDWASRTWIEVPDGVTVVEAPRTVLRTPEEFKRHAGKFHGASQFVDSHVFQELVAS